MKFDIWTVMSAVVALYAAILSTYTFIIQRLDRRGRVRVSLGVHQILTVGGPSETVLALEAVNVGEKMVMLTSHGFQCPQVGKQLRFLVPYPHPMSTGFPHDLVAGKNCHLFSDVYDLCAKLREKGLAGKVKLIGSFADATGRRYTSKPFTLDLDEFQNRAAI